MLLMESRRRSGMFREGRKSADGKEGEAEGRRVKALPSKPLNSSDSRVYLSTLNV